MIATSPAVKVYTLMETSHRFSTDDDDDGDDDGDRDSVDGRDEGGQYHPALKIVDVFLNKDKAYKEAT